MNPQRDYSVGDPTTVRALIELFRRAEDAFRFGVDERGQPETELRAYYAPNNRNNDPSMIGISAINEPDGLTTVIDTIEELGLTIVEDETGTEEGPTLGEYTYRTLSVTTDGATGDWDVPTLLVYGSLTPEVEEACRAALGSGVSLDSIRNHYVVKGESLSSKSKTEIVDSIKRSGEFFESEQRSIVSDVHSATLV